MSTDMLVPITLKSTTINGRDYTATLPARGSTAAAGYDLCAFLPEGTFTTRVEGVTKMTSGEGTVSHVSCEYISVSHTIPVGGRALIPTGLSMALPEGWYGRIAPRSGLAWKNGLDVMAGVIDSDYRGDVGVVLVNLGSTPFEVRHGDRIAQIIIEQCGQVNWHSCEDLSSSSRGTAGYGSTGVARVSDQAIAALNASLEVSTTIPMCSVPTHGTFRYTTGEGGALRSTE
jgi:dUTP pyrophosphatase